MSAAVTNMLRACLQQLLKGLERACSNHSKARSVPTAVTQMLGACLQQSLKCSERAHSSHSNARSVPTAVTQMLGACLQQSLKCSERAHSSHSLTYLPNKPPRPRKHRTLGWQGLPYSWRPDPPRCTLLPRGWFRILHGGKGTISFDKAVLFLN